MVPKKEDLIEQAQDLGLGALTEAEAEYCQATLERNWYDRDPRSQPNDYLRWQAALQALEAEGCTEERFVRLEALNEFLDDLYGYEEDFDGA